MGFSTTVSMVRNSLFRDCALIVQRKKGLGHICDGSSDSQQHSDWYCNPMVIVLLRCFAMKNVAVASLGVTYIRSIGEHAPATIVGPSTCGDDFIHLKYMRNGHELEHHAPFDRVLFPICSPSPSPSAASSEASPTRGRSPTRTASPTGRASPAPPAPLPIGWELATTAAGIPY